MVGNSNQSNTADKKYCKIPTWEVGIKENGTFYLESRYANQETFKQAESRVTKREKRKTLSQRTKPLILSGLAAIALLSTAACSRSKPEKPRALIIDPLSITDPASTDMYKTLVTLAQNGYEEAYICPENVYIAFLKNGRCTQEAYVSTFRELPKSKADIIIIRAHSYDVTTNGNVIVGNNVGVFTSQPYVRELYMDEQRRGDISPAVFLDRKQGVYFGIGPKFVENSMNGKFKKGTTVIVMGCNSLSNDSLAKALFGRGVQNYFGWNGSVTAAHTDKATEVLLRHLVADNMSPQEAVAATNLEAGPDPFYGGSLQVLQNSQSNNQK